MEIPERPRRGRPRADSDPQRAKAYQTIGRTVWQLMAWGFDLRQQAAPLVARLAADLLKVQNADGQPLSSHRIEQIFESWLSTASFGWSSPGNPDRPWTRYNVESLRERRPHNRTIQQIAETLLVNHGKWPRDLPRPSYLGDPVATKKAHEAWLRFNPNFGIGKKKPGS